MCLLQHVPLKKMLTKHCAQLQRLHVVKLDEVKQVHARSDFEDSHMVSTVVKYGTVWVIEPA